MKTPLLGIALHINCVRCPTLCWPAVSGHDALADGDKVRQQHQRRRHRHSVSNTHFIVREMRTMDQLPSPPHPCAKLQQTVDSRNSVRVSARARANAKLFCLQA